MLAIGIDIGIGLKPEVISKKLMFEYVYLLMCIEWLYIKNKYKR